MLATPEREVLMSLIDALLLEEPAPPAPSPSEIFIALRADGLAGTGTQRDPFNGSVAFGAPVSGVIAWADEFDDAFVWWCADEFLGLIECDDEPASFTTDVVVTTTEPQQKSVSGAHGTRNQT